MPKNHVTAIDEHMMCEPRTLRHHVSNLRLLKLDVGWKRDVDALEAVANISIVKVLPEALLRIVITDRSRDHLRRECDRWWRFTERSCSAPRPWCRQRASSRSNHRAVGTWSVVEYFAS